MPERDSVWSLSVRFGDDLMESGFTAVPNLVLENYAALGITPTEMMFIIQVWQYWWRIRDPYPSLNTIAEKLGVSRRQTQRYADGLRTKGLLETSQRYVEGIGQLTNEYDFTPLLRAIREHLKVIHNGIKPTPPRHSRRGGRRQSGQGAPASVMSPEEDS